VTAPAPIDPRAAARAAASGRGLAVKSGRTGSPGTGGRGNRSAAGPGNGRGPAQRDPAWDAPSSDEPPFDPDYDPPVRDAASYEGFDPGDEPLDDVIDEQTARQTSEEQAIQLLREALGAEKIDEAERR
jgi:DNA polymerase-3 subunit gamma/tau